jgi:hypothetical protein
MQSFEKAIASVASKFTQEERRVLVVMGHMMMQHHFEGMKPHGMGKHPPEHEEGK